MSKLYSRLLGLGALLGMLGAVPAWAQTSRPNRCGTEEANEQQQALLQRLIPGYNPARSTNSTAPISAARTNVVYTLPVVFHIIHNGEAVGAGSNIAQAQVQSQLDVLNEDYRNLNADAATVVPTVYQSRRGDTQVQFVMATRDPSGATMAEPGIDRVNRVTKGFTAPPYTQAYNQATIKPQTYWNPEQYINIWVENLGSGLLGYAQFPDNTANLGGLNASGGLASTDGVVILYGSCGSRAKYPAGTYVTNYDRGRTLTHELGHWFSLRHIWGDATCGNDYCNDTPTQNTANYGCVTFPQITCNNVTGDMSQNYMDYSDDRCMALFTADQAGRVQAVMSAGTPRRANLVNSPAICAGTPLVATATSNSPVCAGTSISLTATGPANAVYAWTGPNNFTSSSQNPTIANATTAMAGTYTVRVSVAGSSSCPGAASTTVAVNTAPPVPTLTSSATAAVCAGTSVTLTTPTSTPSGTLPNADFNSGLPTGWAVASTGTGAGTQWQVTTGNTYSYTGGFTLTNLTLNNSRFAIANSDAGGQGSTTNTTLTTPSFSTVGYSALSLAFQQFLYVDSSSPAEVVEVSVDGGTTWTTAATYNAVQGTTTAPAASTVNLNAFLNQANVRVRWHYVDAWGYIWAIDNVVFTGTTSNYTYNYSLVSGDGLPTTTNTPSISVTPTQNSVYRLTVSAPGSVCTSSTTVTVNVIAAPAAPAAPAIASSQNVLCGSGSSMLTASNLPTNLPTGTGVTYQWTLVSGNGLPTTANTANITVSPTVTSSYRLTVTVTNSCGVSASTNSATTTVLVVTNAIQAYPVPFGDAGLTLDISTCTAGAVSAQLYDSMGRLVYDRVIPYSATVQEVPAGNNNKLTLPGSQFLGAGKYTLKVQQGGQNLTFNVVRL